MLGAQLGDLAEPSGKQPFEPLGLKDSAKGIQNNRAQHRAGGGGEDGAGDVHGGGDGQSAAEQEDGLRGDGRKDVFDEDQQKDSQVTKLVDKYQHPLLHGLYSFQICGGWWIIER